MPQTVVVLTKRFPFLHKTTIVLPKSIVVWHKQTTVWHTSIIVWHKEAIVLGKTTIVSPKTIVDLHKKTPRLHQRMTDTHTRTDWRPVGSRVEAVLLRMTIPTRYGPGDQYQLEGEPVPFGFRPIERAGNNWRLNRLVFSGTPWAICRSVAYERISDSDLRRAALATIGHAEELFRAARASSPSGPQAMLYYYSLFCLAKVVGYVEGWFGEDKKVMHGLSAPNGYSVDFHPDTSVAAHMDKAGTDQVNLFNQIWKWQVGAVELPRELPVREIASQTVIGHRIFCRAAAETERFACLRAASIRHVSRSVTEGTDHIYFLVDEQDVNRWGNREDLAATLGLPLTWDVSYTWHHRDLRMCTTLAHCFSQTRNTNDESYASLENSLQAVRTVVHRVINSLPPHYRTYYGCFVPKGGLRVPPMPGALALLFYLGSMNRYHPRKFEDMLNGPFGPFVQEFLLNQPSQLLYSIACDLSGMEIAKSTVVD